MLSTLPHYQSFLKANFIRNNNKILALTLPHAPLLHPKDQWLHQGWPARTGKHPRGSHFYFKSNLAALFIPF